MNSTPSEKSSKRSHPPAAGKAGGRAWFGKERRLLKHADFDRVYRQGKRHFSANMTVFWLKRETQGPSTRASRSLGMTGGSGPRIGFTVGRVMGGAVVRNRIKRRLREAVRMKLGGLHGAVDVVINPKKSSLTAELPKLEQEVEAAFAAIGKSSPPRARTETEG